MTKRSNRLRLVVKESGKTAKDIINSFEKMEKNDRAGKVKYPKDPITISRHINAKRSFDIDMAIAYGKALDADPADICFEPVLKNIRGYTNPVDPKHPWQVNWYLTDDDYKDIISIRVPRDFYADKFRLIEIKSVTNNRHGMIFIYEKSNSTNHANPRSFNQMGLCQLKDDSYILAVPNPSGKKNNFILTDMAKNLICSSCELKAIHPVVNCIFPAFYNHMSDPYS